MKKTPDKPTKMKAWLQQAVGSGLVGEYLASFKKFCVENEAYVQQDVVEAKITYFIVQQANTQTKKASQPAPELAVEPEPDCEACQ